MSAVNKSSYSQSLLLGNARSSLKGLALTAVKYDTAKEMLLRRFSRTEKEIQRRERSPQLDLAADRSSASGKSEVKKKPSKTTGSGLIASGGDTSSSNKKCGFCSRPHYNKKCPIKGLSADQRKEKVKSMKLCFKCLSTKQSVQSCQKTCFFCRGLHHSTLHRQRSVLCRRLSVFQRRQTSVQQHPVDQHLLGSRSFQGATEWLVLTIQPHRKIPQSIHLMKSIPC
ncbi:Bel12-ag transposon polyprotein [Plakobranchus ocellatus]|uniref:Bel12-ag transposon polyprotein n=1 Tax=Plakobranchus ocellatus TaxID=259542 RepID=A0AAV4E2U3_9GAST|nr:Bel12-ag transposon polyprotein [Plakobranchus ocellatus]